jgi:hypothetical protein
MSASQPAYFHLQEFSDLGVPLVGGRLYTYAQGTTALKIAYTDPTGTVPQTYTVDGLGGQYIALNARGELPAPLYLAPGSYDLTLRRADGSTVWTRRADPIGDDATALAAPDGVRLVGNAIDKRALAAPAGAALVGFSQGLDGAVDLAIEDVLRESLSLPRVGAKGDGVVDASPGARKLIDKKHIRLPQGTYRLVTGVDFQPWPISLEGDPSGTVVVVQDDAAKYGFRFGAAGYATPEGVDGRQITYVRGITFTSDVVGAAGLKVQIVHPMFLDLVRFFAMGGKALEMFQQYYGRAHNVVFRDSGMFFTNVNNFSIDGGDISGIVDSPNYSAIEWGSTLIDCDGISFHNLTFESWRNRVIKLVDCKNVSFNSVWFEQNFCDEMVRLEQTTATTFNDCFLELDPPPGVSFIGVDNSNVIGPARSLLTNVAVRGGHLRLDISVFAPAFVNTAPGSRAGLLIDGATIDRGHLFGRGDVRISARNLTLSTPTDVIDQVKTLHCAPHASLFNNYNSWVPQSRQADWNFLLGHGLGEVGTAALTFGIGTADGEFMTGTRAIKVTGIPSNNTRHVISKPMQEMGPVTVDGETHLIFIRFKPSVDMSIIFAIEGFFAEYQLSPDVTYQGNQWHDFVMKTASDVTWNQGRQGFPKLHIKAANTSGTTANLFIDRIDYQTVRGDVFLP